MSETQEKFLDELGALFDKYEIDEMRIEDEKIILHSHCQILAFTSYETTNVDEANFLNITTFRHYYTPKQGGVINGSD